MNDNTRIALILLLVVTLFFVWRSQQSEDLPSLEATNNRADHTMRGVTITQFNEQGALNYLLNSQELEYFVESDRSELKNPDIIFMQANQAAWKIRAKEGLFDHDNEHIHLLYQVVGEQQLAPSANEAPIYFYSDELWVEGRENSAHSTYPTQVIQDQNQLSGDRFFLTINDNQLKLTDNVRGFYVPP